MSYQSEMLEEARRHLAEGDWETAVDLFDELGHYRAAAEACAKHGDAERAAQYLALASGEAA